MTLAGDHDEVTMTSASEALHLDARVIYDELRDRPNFSFPPGNPETWTDDQCRLAIREGEDDSAEWEDRRRWLIERGELVLHYREPA